MIKIKTSDGKEYQLEKKIICQSNLIKNMLDDLEIDDSAIPLPNLTSSIFDIGNF
jgi:S-phase kinase-associated protein 1